MQRGEVDLARSGASFLLVALPFAVLFALALPAAISGGTGSGDRVVAAGFAVGSGLMVFLALSGAMHVRRPRRLVVDHEGLRVEGSRRAGRFRLAWSELAGVGLFVQEARSRRSSWFRSMPTYLELVPADAEAMRRHPELRRQLEVGGGRRWVVGLTVTGAPPPVAELVQRWRPDLWRGSRTGSLARLLRPTRRQWRRPSARAR